MGTHPTPPTDMGPQRGGGGCPHPQDMGYNGIRLQTGGTHPTRMLSFHLCFLFFQCNGRKLENNDVTASFLGDKIVLILRVRIFVRPLYVRFAIYIMQHHFSYLLFHMFTTCLGRMSQDLCTNIS